MEECRAEWPGSFINALAADPTGGVVVGLDYQRVVKLDATCSEIWSKTLPDDQSADALSVDPGGRVVVGGNRAVNGRFGGAGFVAVVDVQGETLWTMELTAPVADVAAGADGVVFAASDAGLVRLTDATIDWEIPPGDAHLGLEIALNAGHDLYVAGACQPWLGDQGCGLPGNAGGLLLSRVRADTGELEWSYAFEHQGVPSHYSSGYWVPALVAAPDGTAVLAGAFGGEMDLGAGPFGRSGHNEFLAAFDREGAVVFSQSWDPGRPPTSSWELVLAVDERGIIGLGGVAATPVDLGGGPLPILGFSIFFGIFSADGTHATSEVVEPSYTGVALVASLGSGVWAVAGTGPEAGFVRYLVR